MSMSKYASKADYDKAQRDATPSLQVIAGHDTLEDQFAAVCAAYDDLSIAHSALYREQLAQQSEKATSEEPPCRVGDAVSLPTRSSRSLLIKVADYLDAANLKPAWQGELDAFIRSVHPFECGPLARCIAPSATERSEWIPVAEGQLPRTTHGDEVLAWTITGHCVLTTPSRIRALHADARQNSEDCFYTHWRETPKGPQ